MKATRCDGIERGGKEAKGDVSSLAASRLERVEVETGAVSGWRAGDAVVKQSAGDASLLLVDDAAVACFALLCWLERRKEEEESEVKVETT